MPLWKIHSHPSTFTPAQRAGLARNITKIYTTGPNGLPPFYVGVLFIDVPEDGMYFSGKPVTNFVRITVEHVARTMPPSDTEKGEKVRRGMMDAVNDAVKEFITEREELQWEVTISETPRDLWRIQGLDPPATHSDAEREWVKLDRPVAYRL